MFDTNRTLLALANGYAAGTLSLEAASAFENRLADDQAARDALTRAVGRLHPDACPDAGYRRAVQHRLHPPLWRRLLTPRRYPGHPSLWALAGAAAVLVGVLCWPTHSPRTAENPVAALPPRVTSAPGQVGVVQVTPAPSVVSTPEEVHPAERPIGQVVRGVRDSRSLVPPMENP